MYLFVVVGFACRCKCGSFTAGVCTLCRAVLNLASVLPSNSIDSDAYACIMQLQNATYIFVSECTETVCQFDALHDLACHFDHMQNSMQLEK